MIKSSRNSNIGDLVLGLFCPLSVCEPVLKILIFSRNQQALLVWVDFRRFVGKFKKIYNAALFCKLGLGEMVEWRDYLEYI